jgi:hypothetical protein
VRLLFRQAARRISAMAIRATENHVQGLVHWLDATVALNAARAFCIGRRL